VPEIEVWRPWTRVLNKSAGITETGSFTIKVRGDTPALLGSEELLEHHIANSISYLLSRRGFDSTASDADYAVRAFYKSERVEVDPAMIAGYQQNTSTVVFSINDEFGGTSGLGVRVARTVGARSTITISSIGVGARFSHKVSLEIYDRSGQLLWKGESTWDSSQLEIRRRLLSALQLLLSDLPFEEGTHPHVKTVKSTHADEYFEISCLGGWFACPALPYRIRFEEKEASLKPGAGEAKVPDRIRDREALDAYVDLIRTAELALPTGKKDHTNPLEPDLWKKVRLGGTYILEPSGRKVNVLIDLKGTAECYVVDKCRLVTDGDFAGYERSLEAWRKRLEHFFDFYEVND
jgi:hypothetical protein